MSTGIFDYEIYNTKTNKDYTITVDKSQCEIDGGFEGITKFAIIEAKCESVDDFIIRQLYYPYRLWKSKLAKKKEVIPIFLSFSNNIFTFYVFSFSDLNNYNSIEIKSVHRYCIGQYEIELSEITEVSKNIKNYEHDSQLTFPQADRFVRVVDLLDKIYFHEGQITKDEITTEYAFTERQTDYYITAGVYLGLIERLKEVSSYQLTDKGKKIMNLDPKRKNLELVKAILSHKIFNLVLHEYLKSAKKPERNKVVDIMRENLINSLSEKTLSRRAGTVEKWIDWILQLTSA